MHVIRASPMGEGFESLKYKPIALFIGYSLHPSIPSPIIMNEQAIYKYPVGDAWYNR